uniref:(northern house mosquito) hypothetical protein n=1 Tax=Culex pipiens TaxID=7175 RepID=A0A8D8AJZ4_CULPI
MTFYKSQTSRAPPPASSRRASRPAFTGPASARPNPPKRAVPGDDRGVPRNVKASRRPSRRRDSSFKPSSCNRPKLERLPSWRATAAATCGRTRRTRRWRAAS